MEYLLLLICNTNLRECHCHVNTSVVMEDILVVRKQLQSTRKSWRLPESFILNWSWRYCFNMWIPSWSLSIIWPYDQTYNDSKTCPREEGRKKKADNDHLPWPGDLNGLTEVGKPTIRSLLQSIKSSTEVTYLIWRMIKTWRRFHLYFYV